MLLTFDEEDSSRLLFVITAPQAKLLRNLNAAIFAKLRPFQTAFVSELFDSRFDVCVRAFVESIYPAIDVGISQIGDGESVLGMRLLCFEIRFAPPYKNISANMTKRYRLAANSDTLDTQDRK